MRAVDARGTTSPCPSPQGEDPHPKVSAANPTRSGAREGAGPRTRARAGPSDSSRAEPLKAAKGWSFLGLATARRGKADRPVRRAFQRRIPAEPRNEHPGSERRRLHRTCYIGQALREHGKCNYPCDTTRDINGDICARPTNARMTIHGGARETLRRQTVTSHQSSGLLRHRSLTK